ncbi:MAG: ribonuclease III [Planctomycetaceae bacterium]|nr:ribonuclease III [Planctomycetaceae bacterium]
MHDCEALLQYEFNNPQLLEQCLTHASVASTRLASNERLEFLGDAVLGLVVCELLFRQFPQHAEGELTRLKSMLVSRHTCAQIAANMGFDQHLIVGKGVNSSGRMPSSIQAAVLESLIAGVYLDGGLEAARTVIERLIAPEVERVTQSDHITNFKSLLQQLAQKMSGVTPVYRILDEKGPDHSKCFQVTAIIGSDSFPAAWEPNKKEAEQNAAQNALCQLQGENEAGSAE